LQARTKKSREGLPRVISDRLLLISVPTFKSDQRTSIDIDPAAG